jgi:hypothetical protein
MLNEKKTIPNNAIHKQLMPCIDTEEPKATVDNTPKAIVTFDTVTAPKATLDNSVISEHRTLGHIVSKIDQLEILPLTLTEIISTYTSYLSTSRLTHGHPPGAVSFYEMTLFLQVYDQFFPIIQNNTFKFKKSVYNCHDCGNKRCCWSPSSFHLVEDDADAAAIVDLTHQNLDPEHKRKALERVQKLFPTTIF